MSDSFVSLKSGKEFDLIFQQGKSYINRHFVIYVLPTENRCKKIAFCAGKKLGNAVRRNRIRRRSKSAFQQIKGRIKKGVSLVIIARFPVYNDDFSALVRSLDGLLEKAGILEEDF
ncbi:MAG TPA: ribonuclease P protein component [Firmicutes bacterium]|nr:ribonuclease P protein component [Bacillota bacterium]